MSNVDLSSLPVRTHEVFRQDCSDSREDEFTRAQVIRFIVQCEMEGEIYFDCPIGEARAIIQRMRVRIAKLRDRAKRSKKTIQAFKMLIVSITKCEDDVTLERVTIKKSKSSASDVLAQLNKLDAEYPGLITGDVWSVK